MIFRNLTVVVACSIASACYRSGDSGQDLRNQVNVLGSSVGTGQNPIPSPTPTTTPTPVSTKDNLAPDSTTETSNTFYSPSPTPSTALTQYPFNRTSPKGGDLFGKWESLCDTANGSGNRRDVVRRMEISSTSLVIETETYKNDGCQNVEDLGREIYTVISYSGPDTGGAVYLFSLKAIEKEYVILSDKAVIKANQLMSCGYSNWKLGVPQKIVEACSVPYEEDEKFFHLTAIDTTKTFSVNFIVDGDFVGTNLSGFVLKRQND